MNGLPQNPDYQKIHDYQTMQGLNDPCGYDGYVFIAFSLLPVAILGFYIVMGLLAKHGYIHE